MRTASPKLKFKREKIVDVSCATGVCRFSEECLSQMLTMEFQALPELTQSGAFKD